jgi:hypothetical protein
MALLLCALGFLLRCQKAKEKAKNQSGEGIARTPKEKTFVVFSRHFVRIHDHSHTPNTIVRLIANFNRAITQQLGLLNDL